MTHKSPMDLPNKLLLVSAALGLMFQIVGFAQQENALYATGALLWVMFIIGASWITLDTLTNWGMVLTGLLFVFGAHMVFGTWAFWVFLAIVPFIAVLARLVFLVIEHRPAVRRHPQKYLLTGLAVLLFLFGAARFIPTLG